MNPKDLEKWPKTPLEIPSQLVQERYAAPKPKEILRERTFEDMLFEFKLRQEKFNINYLPPFLQKDTERRGYITTKDFVQALNEIPIYLTDLEYQWICEKYMTENSQINWRKFVTDIENTPTTNIAERCIQEHEKDVKKENLKSKHKQEIKKRESNIIEILAKIKGKMICYKARINDYMEPYDKEKKELISVEEFMKGLAVHDLNLSEKEINVLLDVFCSPKDCNLVEYKKFTRTIDETSDRLCLVPTPLKVAMQAEAEARVKTPIEYQFLNYHERQIVSLAMKKLSRKLSLGDLDYFKSLDKENKGTISRYTFMNALYYSQVLHTITIKELDIIMKCFGFITDQDEIEINYFDFLKAVDIVFKTQKAAEAI